MRKAHRLLWVCAFFGLASWMLAALLSYDAYDPSWNTAIDGDSSNWAKSVGGYFADAVFQIFGMAAYVVPFLLLCWGGLVLKRRSVSYGIFRGISAVGVLPFASIMLAKINSGGLLGRLIFLKLTKTFEAFVGPFPIDLTFWGAMILTILSFMFASGLRLKDFSLLFKKMGIILKAVSFAFQKILSVLMPLFTRHSLAGFNRPVEPVGGAIFADFPKEESASFPGNKSTDLYSHRVLERAGAFDGETLSSGSSEPLLSPEVSEKKSSFWSRSQGAAHEESSENLGRGKGAHLKENIVDLSTISHDYQLPPMDLLSMPVVDQKASQSNDYLEDSAQQLSGVLDDYGVRGDITKVCPGPVVTLYELTPAPGVKSSRVTGLSDDIARSMCALSARVSTIPGQNAMGIELPNKVRQTVFLRELLSERRFENTSSKLALALGKDIGGRSVITDLARMPHLLVAGTTGSGKSVAINTMILSLLYRLPPEKCRFLMIDPKMLELSIYNDIPHLLAPVVTDPKKAIVALKWAVREMEDRYRSMSRVGVRNIEGYNARLAEAQKRGEELTRQVHTGFDLETGKPIYETQPLDMTELPYIVVIVDEMADLMMVAGKEIEAAVQRLAQMARAAGIHLIMATQRPSVDVITGTIKANFPTRISFQVTSKFDSRTILGEQGAEQLLGRGDMLYMEAGGKTQRVHGPFVSDEDVERVVSALKEQGVPDYLEAVTDESADTPLGSFGGEEASEGDALYHQAVAIVQREGKASTSFVQRHLQIGYNRAARVIEQMEAEGIISAANHVGKREVLIKKTG